MWIFIFKATIAISRSIGNTDSVKWVVNFKIHKRIINCESEYIFFAYFQDLMCNQKHF